MPFQSQAILKISQELIMTRSLFSKEVNRKPTQKRLAVLALFSDSFFDWRVVPFERSRLQTHASVSEKHQIGNKTSRNSRNQHNTPQLIHIKRANAENFIKRGF